MSNCEHTTADIARIDPNGITLHDDDTLTMWGECECGFATTVTAEITNVEVADHA